MSRSYRRSREFYEAIKLIYMPSITELHPPRELRRQDFDENAFSATTRPVYRRRQRGCPSAVSSASRQRSTKAAGGIFGAFMVAAEFIRTEIIELRNIEIGLRIEADMLSVGQQDEAALKLEPIVLFQSVIKRVEDEANVERHARYWRLNTQSRFSRRATRRRCPSVY